MSPPANILNFSQPLPSRAQHHPFQNNQEQLERSRCIPLLNIHVGSPSRQRGADDALLRAPHVAVPARPRRPDWVSN